MSSRPHVSGHHLFCQLQAPANSLRLEAEAALGVSEDRFGVDEPLEAGAIAVVQASGWIAKTLSVAESHGSSIAIKQRRKLTAWARFPCASYKVNVNLGIA